MDSHTELQTARPETVYTQSSNSSLPDPKWSILLMNCHGQPLHDSSSGCSGSPWPPDLAVSHMVGLSIQQLARLAEDQASISLSCVSIASYSS